MAEKKTVKLSDGVRMMCGFWAIVNDNIDLCEYAGWDKAKVNEAKCAWQLMWSSPSRALDIFKFERDKMDHEVMTIIAQAITLSLALLQNDSASFLGAF